MQINGNIDFIEEQICVIIVQIIIKVLVSIYTKYSTRMGILTVHIQT